MKKARIIKMLELGTSPNEILLSLNERDRAIYDYLKQGTPFKEIQNILSASPNQIAFINKYLIKKQFDGPATAIPDTIKSDGELESVEPTITSDAKKESVEPTITSDAEPQSIVPAIKSDAKPESIVPAIKSDAKSEPLEPATIKPAFAEPAKKSDTFKTVIRRIGLR